MRAKTIQENIHFERGQDPKKSMGIGKITQIPINAEALLRYDQEERKNMILAIRFYKEYASISCDSSDDLTDKERVDYIRELLKKFDFQYLVKLYPARIKSGGGVDSLIFDLSELGEQIGPKKRYFLDGKTNELKIEDNSASKFVEDYIFSKELKESQNFERGKDPKESMDIGIKTWNKIKPGDIFVLRGPRVYLDKPIKEYLDLWEDLAFLTVEVKRKGNNIELAYWGSLGTNISVRTWEDVKFNPGIRLGKTYLSGTKEQFEKTFRILQKDEIEAIKSGLGESLKFERGKDPKTSMRIGKLFKPIDFSSYEEYVNFIAKNIFLISEISSLNGLIGIDPTGHYWIHNDFQNKIEKYLDYCTINGKTDNIEIRIQDLYNALNNMGFLKESANFERGQDPKQIMGIGAKQKLIKMIPEKLKNATLWNKDLEEILFILKSSLTTVNFTENEIIIYSKLKPASYMLRYIINMINFDKTIIKEKTFLTDERGTTLTLVFL